MKIQEDSLIPKYHQIKDFLLGYIRDNHLVEGDPLPSESSLIKEYRVSRNTIRLAFDLLVKEGLAEKIQGKGTFYREPSSRKAKSTHLIGLILPLSLQSVRDALPAMEELLYKRAYTLLIGNSSDDMPKEQVLLERFINRNIEGLMIQPLSRVQNSLLQTLSVPFILQEEAVPDYTDSLRKLLDMIELQK